MKASAAKPVACPDGKPIPPSPVSAALTGRGLATISFAVISVMPATAGATTHTAACVHNRRCVQITVAATAAMATTAAGDPNSVKTREAR